METEERYAGWGEQPPLGEGAYGEVHKLFDTYLKCHVAIKLLRPKHIREKHLVDALYQEVLVSRELRHVCICPIHDIYKGAHGIGIVMDFIDGIPLSAWLRSTMGRLSETINERLELFRKLSEALAFAHTKIVHRDLKPDNIFLLKSDPNRPVIMDFGTAVLGSEARDGLVAGTYRYMSPEQLNAPEKVDQRADLFALGVIAYELFTGQIPPTSSYYGQRTKEGGRIPPQVDLETIEKPSAFCPALPAEFDRIILQLMAYDRKDRPHSADDVLVVFRNREDRYTGWGEWLLGKGAYGEVYKLHDTLLKRDVAIKLLKPEHVSAAHLVETLRQEVVVSRELRHECICPIHDVYQGPRGIGIVMDFVDGISLSRWLKDNRGRLLDTAAERLELFRKLSDALAFAHTKIVHRDLKPDNIFLLNGDPTRPMIMDFGTAVLGANAQDGLVAGTYKYMSPEQLNAPESVDRRADLFALGIIVYELFTGLIPPTSSYYGQRTGRRVPIPPKVDLDAIERPSSFCAALPAELDRIVLLLMAYNREDRPQSAHEVSAVLKGIRLKQGDVLAGVGQFSQEALAASTVGVPGGSFYLGAATQQPDSMEHERPRTRVRLSPFRMGMYPVTVLEYWRFVRATGCTVHKGIGEFCPALLRDRPPSPSQGDLPVVGVDYADALSYARWAGGSLPSEAQWEYAAKGNKAFFPLYPWGDEPLTPLRANIDGASKTTSPVGSYRAGASPFGVFDLCGNVWEWCLDVWDPYYYGMLQANCLDPVCSVEGMGTERVLRGGAFDSFASQGRCSARFHAPPDTRSHTIGFRVVFPA